MRIEILLTTASFLLFLIAIPQITFAQKDDEAQSLLIDERNQQTLKFSNQGALNQRTDLKTNPVSDLERYNFAGVQINLTERLAASNSREQKLAFLMQGIPSCTRYVKNPKPYTNFLKLAIRDLP